MNNYHITSRKRQPMVIQAASRSEAISIYCAATGSKRSDIVSVAETAGAF